jgi:hypothetical protein
MGPFLTSDPFWLFTEKRYAAYPVYSSLYQAHWMDWVVPLGQDGLWSQSLFASSSAREGGFLKKPSWPEVGSVRESKKRGIIWMERSMVRIGEV